MGLREFVRDRLRDPSSYEHVATLVDPLTEDHTRSLEMTFRARNEYGGMNEMYASAIPDNETCEVELLRMTNL